MLFIHCAACVSTNQAQRLVAFIDGKDHVHFRCESHDPPKHIATFELRDPAIGVECAICSKGAT